MLEDDYTKLIKRYRLTEVEKEYLALAKGDSCTKIAKILKGRIEIYQYLQGKKHGI